MPEVSTGHIFFKTVLTELAKYVRFIGSTGDHMGQGWQ
jgi:hypothetical protein